MIEEERRAEVEKEPLTLPKKKEKQRLRKLLNGSRACEKGKYHKNPDQKRWKCLY